MSKSLGLKSRPISTAKISTHRLPQTWQANASLSGCHSFSICKARAVVSPQYPVSASLFSWRYAASFFLHRSACSHVSCLPGLTIERDTQRATLTVDGPADSLWRTVVSENSDESTPIARRNSGTTPWVMVSVVKGRATSSASNASANSIQREYPRLGHRELSSTKAPNDSDRRKPLTTCA